MKQIPILSGRCLVVELPEGVTKVQDSYANGFIYTMDDGYVETWYADEDGGLDGNWHVIGMLSEVTEKTLSTVLDSAELKEGRRLYNIHDEPYPNRLTDSALESLESAILAEGYCIDSNPYGFPTETEYEGKVWRDEVIEADIKAYNEAQSRVLDRSRCLLLGREI